MKSVDQSVTQAEFGSLIGVSQQAVSELLSRGVLTGGAPSGVWLREYCSHLREQAAVRAGAGDLELAAERTLLAKAQTRSTNELADKLAIANAVTRSELAPRHLMTEVLAKAGARIAGIFDGIVPKLLRCNTSLTLSDFEMIAAEISKARNAVTSLSLSTLDQEDDADVRTGSDVQHDGDPIQSAQGGKDETA